MPSPQKENGFTPIANEIMEALAKIRIPGEARQMLDVIIRKTYGYQKKDDLISTSQFCQLTGLKKFIIHRARKRLLLAKLITVSRNDNSQVLKYSFQKDYSKWVTVSKNAQCAKKVTNSMQNCSPTVTIIDGHNRKKEIKKDICATSIAQTYFYSSYKKAFQKEYIAAFGKDGAIFKGLLAIIPIEELKTLIDKFFISEDDFIKKSDYGVGVFRSVINKLQKPKEKLKESVRYE